MSVCLPAIPWVRCLSAAALVVLASCQSSNQKDSPAGTAVPPLQRLNVVLVTIDTLRTDPIDVAQLTANTAVETAALLPDPKLRFVDNPIVRVELKVRRR